MLDSLKTPAKKAIQELQRRIRPPFHRFCFVPCLKGNPDHCERMRVEVQGRGQYSSLFVNGQEVPGINGVRSGRERAVWECAANLFEPWENVLAVQGTVPAQGLTLRPPLELPPLPPSELGVPSGPRASAWRYLRNAWNPYPRSQFQGTFLAAYDLQAQSFRLNSWVWCSAAVVKALLEEYRATAQEEYRQWAEKTGTAILRFQREEGPEAGGIMVRWDIGTDSPMGIVPWLAPNDSAFIGSYALIPLYEATGDPVWSRAALRIGEWILWRGMDSTGRLYVGYREDQQRWDQSWLYVDAGFTATLFQALYHLTGEPRWKEATQRFMQDYLARFQSPEGYFYKLWRAPDQLDRRIFARGQAWAMDGLISAWQLLGANIYRDRLLACADFMVQQQKPNGSWLYLVDDPDSGECAKGTPILAYHLLRLYELTERKSYLQAAQRALQWCEEHQYQGEDPFAVGGIHAYSEEGCIAGTRQTDCIFTYAVAYYLLGLNRLGHLTP